MSTSPPLRASAPFARSALAGLTLLALAPAAFAQASGVPLMSPALGSPGAASAPAAAPSGGSASRRVSSQAPVVNGFTTISWEALVPADWDPFKGMKDVNLAAMSDSDPRAAAMLKQMREVWDNAPTNPVLVGQKVRIPGFVVPLEDSKDGLKEFLLVPYFGACVHSPPPPANQIIFVAPQSPAKGLRSMDAVWISGVLKTDRSDSYMGAASYRIEAQAVTPYQERPR
jgi:hypothetical protein